MTGLLIAGSLLLAGCSANTEEERSNKIMTLNNKQQAALDHALGLITVPENYTLTQVREGVQDGENVFVFRYTKSDNTELLGEHFSFTVMEKTIDCLV